MIVRNKNSLNRTIVIVLVFIIAVLLVLLVYFTLFTKNNPTEKYKPLYPTADSQTKSSATSETKTIKTPGAQPSPQTSDSIPVSNSGSVNISNLNQRDGFVNALADVQNFSASKCVYMFESDGAKPVIREQSGSCSGVSIPQVEFEKIGKYKLTVTVYGGDSKISTSGDINIT